MRCGCKKYQAGPSHVYADSAAGYRPECCSGNRTEGPANAMSGAREKGTNEFGSGSFATFSHVAATPLLRGEELGER
jgi:hypothetical protein